MVEHTRTLDFKIAFAIGLGTMIAAGILSHSGVGVAEVDSSAVISFVIVTVVTSIIPPRAVNAPRITSRPVAC